MNGEKEITQLRAELAENKRACESLQKQIVEVAKFAVEIAKALNTKGATK